MLTANKPHFLKFIFKFLFSFLIYIKEKKISQKKRCKLFTVKVAIKKPIFPIFSIRLKDGDNSEDIILSKELSNTRLHTHTQTEKKCWYVRFILYPDNCVSG